MQAWTGLNSHWEEEVRKTPPHLSSAAACAVFGNTDTANNNADADAKGRTRMLMIRFPRLAKLPRTESQLVCQHIAVSVPLTRKARAGPPWRSSASNRLAISRPDRLLYSHDQRIATRLSRYPRAQRGHDRGRLSRANSHTCGSSPL